MSLGERDGGGDSGLSGDGKAQPGQEAESEATRGWGARGEHTCTQSPVTSRPQEGGSRVTSKPVNTLRAELGPCLSWIQPQAYPRDLGSKLLLNHPAQSMETLSPSSQLPAICPLLTSPRTLLPLAGTESGEFLKHAALCPPAGLCPSGSLSPNVLSFSPPHQGNAS